LRRLGHLEKLILTNLLGLEQKKPLYDSLIEFKNRRLEWAGGIPLLKVRNRILGVEFITPANKASFSRALRRLEEKGMIVTRNHVSVARYRTHAWLTDEGRQKARTLR
jgi:hypothetical protein